MHASSPHHLKMIGCDVSKLGGRANFQARLRPLLLQGLAGMRTWRLSPRPSLAKDTPGLLLAEPEPKKSVAMATVIGSTYGIKVGSSKRPSLRLRVKSRTKHGHIARPNPKKLDADSDEDDEGRKISSFPGSPSFRVFFLDAAGDDGAGGNHDIVEEIVYSSMSKEAICVQKKVKRERKKRANIKTVMSGKGREAMKSLLNVKACCHSPTLSAANTTKSGPS